MRRQLSVDVSRSLSLRRNQKPPRAVFCRLQERTVEVCERGAYGIGGTCETEASSR